MNRRLSLDADLRRMLPSTIDYADVALLRAVDVSGYTPEIGDADRCAPAVVRQYEYARRTIDVEGACDVEADYGARTFVRTDCVATHGLAELEVGAASRCCCYGWHCDPIDYDCEPL